MCYERSKNMAKDFGCLLIHQILEAGLELINGAENKYGIGLGNGKLLFNNGSDGYWKRVERDYTMWERLWVALGESNP